MVFLIASSIIGLVMAIVMMYMRVKQQSKPTSRYKIIIPPIFMSTGSLMFLFPVFRISSVDVLKAVLVGCVLSILLIKTTRLHIYQEEIYIKPSRSFIVIFLSLLLFRVISRFFYGQQLSLGETSGFFYVLALSMIISWRFTTFIRFLRLEKKLETKKPRAQ